MVPRWFTRSVLSRRLAGGRPIFTGGRSAPGDLGPARRLQRPRTRLADAVEELLQDSSPRLLVDHCHRSLELALLIAAASGADLDVEVLHAGVLLHDLGLTPRFHSPTLRFEVASADAARDLVRAHGMDPARAGKVWDVAVLHATGGIADCQSPGNRRRRRRHRHRRHRPGPGPVRPRRPRPDHGYPAGLCPPLHRRRGHRSAGQAAGRLLHLDGEHRRRPHPRLRPVRVEQLALAHPFETVKSQAQAP
jgi:hypothetical protein